MYLYKFIKNKIEKEKNVNPLSNFIQMLKKYYKEFKTNDNVNFIKNMHKKMSQNIEIL